MIRSLRAENRNRQKRQRKYRTDRHRKAADRKVMCDANREVEPGEPPRSDVSTSQC